MRSQSQGKTEGSLLIANVIQLGQRKIYPTENCNSAADDSQNYSFEVGDSWISIQDR